MALNGIDISGWQSGINLSAVPADFVIIKVTEGSSYVSPDCDRQYQQAKKAGKLLGVYHYADGGNVQAEADHFLQTCKGYIGEAILCLDWESQGNPAFGSRIERTWVAQWLAYVTQKTDIKPLLYCSSSVMGRLTGLGDYGFWIAQYANNKATGYQDKPWNEGAYACAIRQYSSCGQLPGYSGRLDLDKFYGDKTAWLKYAGTKATAPAKKPAKPKITIPVEKQGVYRLYNLNSGEHVFTAEQKEAQNLADAGWTYEGIAWHEAGDVDVYRLYSGNEHMYVTKIKELADLVIAKWSLEKSAFKCFAEPGDDRVPVFRLYNKNGGRHMFTADVKERDTLVRAGWTLEGIAFYEHK